MITSNASMRSVVNVSTAVRLAIYDFLDIWRCVFTQYILSDTTLFWPSRPSRTRSEICILQWAVGEACRRPCAVGEMVHTMKWINSSMSLPACSNNDEHIYDLLSNHVTESYLYDCLLLPLQFVGFTSDSSSAEFVSRPWQRASLCAKPLRFSIPMPVSYHW